jgi:uncharacterized protein YecT (DUF1311 family)
MWLRAAVQLRCPTPVFGREVCARELGRVLAALLTLCVRADLALAQAELPRRIAPERFPEYRGSLLESQPQRRVLNSQQPLGSCESAGPRSQWLRCLRETGTLLDEKLEETVATIADQIGARPGLNPARARHWRIALGKAQEKWRDFRDYECGQVASSERGMAVDGYEAQLLCRLRTAQERLSDLARRYPPNDAARPEDTR